jgi:hypothetical protein
MKEWENMFEVRRIEHSEADRGLYFHRFSWAVFRKGQTEKYGRYYSSSTDAKRGAAHIYRFYIKSFEKNILGQ